MYISEFLYNKESKEYATASFNEAGEIKYANNDEPAYASKAEDGIIYASKDTSTFEFKYASNVMVLGNGNSNSLLTPFASGTTDISICVKKQDGTDAKDYVIDSELFVANNRAYVLYRVLLNDKPYISLLVDPTNKDIIFDVDVVLASGESFKDDEAVYTLYKGEERLMDIGYIEDGGYKNRFIMSNGMNTFTNKDHTLLFINDEECVYDDAEFTYKMKIINMYY